MHALKQPVVWAPVLAVILVFAGIKIPDPLDKSFALLGQATGGLALFAAGIVLFSRKIEISLACILSVSLATCSFPPPYCWRCGAFIFPSTSCA